MPVLANWSPAASNVCAICPKASSGDCTESCARATLSSRLFPIATGKSGCCSNDRRSRGRSSISRACCLSSRSSYHSGLSAAKRGDVPIGTSATAWLYRVGSVPAESRRASRTDGRDGCETGSSASSESSTGVCGSRGAATTSCLRVGRHPAAHQSLPAAGQRCRCAASVLA